jgi:hypothetical protein
MAFFQPGDGPACGPFGILLDEETATAVVVAHGSLSMCRIAVMIARRRSVSARSPGLLLQTV